MEYTGKLMVLFLIILIGYLARKIRLVPEEAPDMVVKLILNITLPLLILVSLNLPYEKALVDAMIQTGITAVIFTLVIILLAGLLVRPLSLGNGEKRQWQFMLIFGNVTFIGYPICHMILGDPGVFLAAVFDLVQTVLMFSYGIFLLSGSRRGMGRQGLSLLKDPVILALVAGLVLFLARVDLPGPVAEAFSLVGSATTALSMLAVGLLLRFSRGEARGEEFPLALLVILKLVLVPLAFLLLTRDLGMNPMAWTISVIMIAVPSGILATVLSVRYTGDGRFTARGIFFTHLFSILTIPLILKIMEVV